MKLAWAATNALPEKLVVYKVKPFFFSESVISNVMRLGPFSKEDSTRLPSEINDRAASFYLKRASGASLTISPALGLIRFSNERARAASFKDAEGVPTEAQAVALAEQLLPQLGIDRPEFVHSNGSRGLKYISRKREGGGGDPQTKKLVKKPLSWEIAFTREKDGIEFAGRGRNGGVTAIFGNHASLAGLEVSWRNLEPVVSPKVASRSRLTQWIQEGRFVMAPGPATELDDFNRPSKIEIHRMTIYYLGPERDKAADYIVPFLTLDGTGEFDGKALPITLNGPVCESD